MTPVLAATASEQAELIVFVVLAPLAVVTALGMVLTRNAVYSALLLVVTSSAWPGSTCCSRPSSWPPCR